MEGIDESTEIREGEESPSKSNDLKSLFVAELVEWSLLAPEMCGWFESNHGQF